MRGIDPSVSRHARPLLVAVAMPLSFLASGCTTGSSASLTMAPLFFAESVDRDGNVVDGSNGNTAASPAAGQGLASSVAPRFILAGGNANLPLALAGRAGAGEAEVLAALAVIGGTSLTPDLAVALGVVPAAEQAVVGRLVGRSGVAGGAALNAAASLVAVSAAAGASLAVLPDVLPVQATVTPSLSVAVNGAAPGATVTGTLPALGGVVATADAGAALAVAVPIVAAPVTSVSAIAAPVAAATAPVVASVGAVVAPVAAMTAPRAAVVAPVLTAAAPVAVVAAPVVAPVVAAVPAAIPAAVGALLATPGLSGIAGAVQ